MGCSSSKQAPVPAQQPSLQSDSAPPSSPQPAPPSSPQPDVTALEPEGPTPSPGSPAQTGAPLLEQLRQHAQAGLEKAVLESGSGEVRARISYAELLEQVEEVAKGIAALLAARSPTLPPHVAYLISPGIAYVVVELAVWRCGGVCVPLSVHSPAPELEYFLQDSEVAVTIADGALEAKLQPLAEKLGRSFASISPTADAHPSGGAGNVKSAPRFALKPLPGAGGDGAAPMDDGVDIESRALILYTSGTTGKPKGAVHTYQSLTAQMQSLTEAWKWSSRDHTLHVLPLHHIHGVQNILNTALWSGAAVEFASFDASHALARLTSGDITNFHAVPTIYSKLMQHLDSLDAQTVEGICAGLRHTNLRYMVSGSAALPVPTMCAWAERSGHVLLERYGMTEIGMALSNNLEGTRYPGYVGFPLPQVQVKLDEEGGILVRGSAVFKEYYNRPDATAKEFTEDGWFRTGDTAVVGGTTEELQKMKESARNLEEATGRQPADSKDAASGTDLSGIYRIMGRTSLDIIKSGGYKISGLEVESVLLLHEAIKECAVVGSSDETWGERVTAVCVLNGDLTLADLRTWAKEKLATYKVPASLVVVTELPRNQMGKLEKKKVLEFLNQTPQQQQAKALPDGLHVGDAVVSTVEFKRNNGEALGIGDVGKVLGPSTVKDDNRRINCEFPNMKSVNLAPTQFEVKAAERPWFACCSPPSDAGAVEHA